MSQENLLGLDQIRQNLGDPDDHLLDNDVLRWATSEVGMIRARTKIIKFILYLFIINNNKI